MEQITPSSASTLVSMHVASDPATPPLIQVSDLCFSYDGSSNWIVDHASFDVPSGSIMGIVGESGSGKSTLVRLLCGLISYNAGSAKFDGREIRDWRRDSMEFRRRNQIVFQSPASSFDPRMSMRRALQQPVRSIERRVPGQEELARWVQRVGLDPEQLKRFPHQLSGGQLQRMALARALSVKPEVLFADEPTSALDVSVQAKVLNQLTDIRRSLGLTIVLVTHDLAVVARMCASIVVMSRGRIVESGATASVLGNPQHDYTKRLIEAADAVSLDIGEVG